MMRLLVLAALLFLAGGVAAQTDPEEFAYCAYNPRISEGESCFYKYEDAEKYVLEDPTSMKRRRFLHPVPAATFLGKSVVQQPTIDSLESVASRSPTTRPATPRSTGTAGPLRMAIMVVWSLRPRRA